MNILEKKTFRLLLLGAVLSVIIIFTPTRDPHTVANPDPNHTHADFAVWVLGKKLDFSDAHYMSGSSTDEHTHDEEGEYLNQYLHLHDGNGHVLHGHKPGLTIGEYFASLGLPMTGNCFSLDEFQFSSLDSGIVASYALTRELCTNGKFHWQMIVNGQERPFDPSYTFGDLDQILLLYQAGDTWDAEWKQMTDDACLYSKRCPWRGEPPTENCIADPAVPCTVPEDEL